MTDIAAATSTASATATRAASSSQSTNGLTSGSGLADYDDFLTLLTTQLRNQDPLNPQDSTEFVSQIAQFTGVEQQINTNTKLDNLIGLQTGDTLTELAAWIGRTVSAPSAGFAFDGSPLEFQMPADPSYTTASVTIRDDLGREVAVLPASPRGGAMTWDGTKTDGSTAPEGVYRIDFTYGRNGSNGPESRVLSVSGSGRVVEARLTADGAPELVLDSGAVIDPAAATSVKETAEADA